MERERPIGTYLTLSLTYNVAAWTISALLGRRGRASASDVALLGTATHQITRILAKDRVTTAVRSPFVDQTADGEQPKREGPRRALGELLTCPYCLAPWIALGLTSAFLVARTTTRTFCTVMAVAAVSDFLNRSYAIAQEKRHELAERAEALAP